MALVTKWEDVPLSTWVCLYGVIKDQLLSRSYGGGVYEIGLLEEILYFVGRKNYFD